MRKLLDLPVRGRMSPIRYLAAKDLAQFDAINRDLEEQIALCLKENRTGEE